MAIYRDLALADVAACLREPPSGQGSPAPALPATRRLQAVGSDTLARHRFRPPPPLKLTAKFTVTLGPSVRSLKAALRQVQSHSAGLQRVRAPSPPTIFSFSSSSSNVPAGPLKCAQGAMRGWLAARAAIFSSRSASGLSPARLAFALFRPLHLLILLAMLDVPPRLPRSVTGQLLPRHRMRRPCRVDGDTAPPSSSGCAPAPGTTCR